MVLFLSHLTADARTILVRDKKGSPSIHLTASKSLLLPSPFLKLQFPAITVVS